MGRRVETEVKLALIYDHDWPVIQMFCCTDHKLLYVTVRHNRRYRNLYIYGLLIHLVTPTHRLLQGNLISVITILKDDPLRYLGEYLAVASAIPNTRGIDCILVVPRKHHVHQNSEAHKVRPCLTRLVRWGHCSPVHMPIYAENDVSCRARPNLHVSEINPAHPLLARPSSYRR